MSNNSKFEIGFWIPFGENCGETSEEIIKRKQNEIKNNGWTLWSFSHRLTQTLDLWFKEIKKYDTGNVKVFCSGGKSVKDHVSASKKYYNYYKPIDESSFSKIPSAIKVPIRSANTEVVYSAFKVKKIIDRPFNFEKETIQWWKKNEDGKTSDWQQERLPTRNEFLIRPGQGESMRDFRVVLQLEYPFLAEMKFSI